MATQAISIRKFVPSIKINLSVATVRKYTWIAFVALFICASTYAAMVIGRAVVLANTGVNTQEITALSEAITSYPVIAMFVLFLYVTNAYKSPKLRRPIMMDITIALVAIIMPQAGFHIASLLETIRLYGMGYPILTASVTSTMFVAPLVVLFVEHVGKLAVSRIRAFAKARVTRRNNKPAVAK